MTLEPWQGRHGGGISLGHDSLQRFALIVFEKSLDRIMIACQNKFNKVMSPAKQYPIVQAAADFPEVIPEALEANSCGHRNSCF